MPKGGRKGEKKSNRDIASDVKLSDFADCSAHPGRLRKSAGSNLDKEVQGVSSSEALWFERDLDDFEFPSTSSETRKKQTKCKVTPEDLKNRPGIQYPIDVWYLIGQFIKPEDVKIFAAICKGSYCVSRTYSFWIAMYKRHYQADANLPYRLKPECMEGSLCLKVYVIRALYHMYPHLKSQLSHSADVYSLTNLCCSSMWRIHQNGKWLFHFKLVPPASVDYGAADPAPLDYRIAIQDMWTSPDGEGKTCERYVNYNPDEGCKILRISCSHFVIVSPFVMGSRLSDVRINLAHDMRRQKLQLTFCHANYRKTTTAAAGVYGDIVEFDPVENIAILDWWHPQYPSGWKL